MSRRFLSPYDDSTNTLDDVAGDPAAYLRARARAAATRFGSTAPDRAGRTNYIPGYGVSAAENSGGTLNKGNAFDNGFFVNSAANLTPEARIASQGNSAENQWAQAGAVTGVNPTELNRLNRLRIDSRVSRGDVGTVLDKFINPMSDAEASMTELEHGPRDRFGYAMPVRGTYKPAVAPRRMISAVAPAPTSLTPWRLSLAQNLAASRPRSDTFLRTIKPY